MDLTVAPSQDPSDYHKALAWLDTRIGNRSTVVLYAVVGTLLIGLWLFLDAYKPDTSLIYARDLSRTIDGSILGATIACKWLGLLYLGLATLGVPILVLCWAARTTSNIVRLNPTALTMLEFQLSSFGLDDRKSAALRWLADKMPQRLHEAVRTWENDKQQHGENVEMLEQDDSQLCTSLSRLVAACKEADEI